MNQNPYSPPAANVSDVPLPQLPMQRPPQVVTAIKLAIVSYGLGLLTLAVSWDYHAALQPSIVGMILGQLFSVGITAWIYYKIYVGRNWARILLLVLSVLGALMTLLVPASGILAQAPILVKIQMVIGTVFTLWILWLLFSAPGRHWFERRDKQLAPLPDKLG